jgi:hypothetical protein
MHITGNQHLPLLGPRQQVDILGYTFSLPIGQMNMSNIEACYETQKMLKIILDILMTLLIDLMYDTSTLGNAFHEIGGLALEAIWISIL